jgi:hypothetical protein
LGVAGGAPAPATAPPLPFGAFPRFGTAAAGYKRRCRREPATGAAASASDRGVGSGNLIGSGGSIFGGDLVYGGADSRLVPAAVHCRYWVSIFRPRRRRFSGRYCHHRLRRRCGTREVRWACGGRRRFRAQRQRRQRGRQ